MIVNKIEKLDKDSFLCFQKQYINNLKEYFIHYIDGNQIQKEHDYLEHFKKVYNFPNYYGNNYNAFIDCMRDLDFREEQGFIIVIYNYSVLLGGETKEVERFIKALKYIAYYLEKESLTTSGGRNHLKSFDVYLINEDLSEEQFIDIKMSKA